MFYKYTKKQRRFIKILKELGYIKSSKEIDQPYNTMTIGVRGNGKTVKMALMVLFSKVDLTSSEYAEHNSCVISSTQYGSQASMDTINNLMRYIEREYIKKYKSRLFYDIQAKKGSNHIYVNNHKIRFINGANSHYEGIHWKVFNDVYVDEFTLSEIGKDDAFWGELLHRGALHRYDIKAHLFGTDIGPKIFEAKQQFVKKELPITIESMSLSRLSYRPEVEEKGNKLWIAIKRAMDDVLEFLLLK